MDSDRRLNLRWWWFLAPGYLTVWTLGFAAWGFLDGAAMFEAFQIPVHAETAHDQFILQNSAARYLGIGVALTLGVFVFRTKTAIYTAVAARLAMDIFDLVAGLRTGVLADPVSGTLQSIAMFWLPSVLTLLLLRRAQR